MRMSAESWKAIIDGQYDEKLAMWGRIKALARRVEALSWMLDWASDQEGYDECQPPHTIEEAEAAWQSSQSVHAELR